MIKNNPWEFIFFIPTITTKLISMGKISHPSSLFSNSLFSSIVTLYILILLYFPPIFPKLVISPLLISTLVLLLSLLRLGASQQIRRRLQQQQPPSVDPAEPKAKLRDTCQCVEPRNNPNKLETKPEPHPQPKPNTFVKERIEADNSLEEAKVEPHCDRAETRPVTEPGPGPEPEPETLHIIANHEEGTNEPDLRRAKSEPDPKPSHRESSTEWVVWAPLEVIYEAYEGEESEDERQNDPFSDSYNFCKGGTEKYSSLSRYYPEPDSDADADTDTDSSCSSLDEGFPAIQRWGEEEREGLIEIALDYGLVDKSMIMKAKEVEVDDEDNLIEIDISPTRTTSEFSW